MTAKPEMFELFDSDVPLTSSEDPDLNADPLLHAVPRPRRRFPDPVSPVDDVVFNEFWAVYPHKASRKGARSRFAIVVAEGADPEAIIAAAQAFNEFCRDTGREKKFIRRAERWLAEKPWEHGVPFYDPPPRQPRSVSCSNLDPETLVLLEPRSGWHDDVLLKPPSPRPATPQRRAEVLARVYCMLQPLSSQRSVQHVVEKAIAAKRWSDLDIGTALERLAGADRKLTENALRSELLYRLTEHRRRFERADLKATEVVYLVKADESPLVKIGTSETAPTRLYQLQLACPVELKILHTIPGGHELETALHHEFAPRRRHGEWFDFSDVDPVEAVMRRLPIVLRRLDEQRAKNDAPG